MAYASVRLMPWPSSLFIRRRHVEAGYAVLVVLLKVVQFGMVLMPVRKGSEMLEAMLVAAKSWRSHGLQMLAVDLINAGCDEVLAIPEVANAGSGFD